ncbi:MAG: hypothetical protein ACYTBP_06735 [Planctomycetota bacterium]|jgi:hypothetical protein
MAGFEKLKHIAVELKGHSPFTIFGAVLGIVFMLIFRKLSFTGSQGLFSVFHPAHVVLSAMVTASMFKLHAFRKNILLVIVVGYIGSIGIATLSDIIIPHIGTHLLGLDIPTHTDLHSLDQDTHSDEAAVNISEDTSLTADAHAEHDHESEHGIHFAFIEEWYIVNPAALLGIFIAFFLPRTKFPHAGHILISTWASSSYLLMQLQSDITAAALIGMFVTLFMAVWLPCCISDIIFPLLFVNSDLTVEEPCLCHGRHSHQHLPKETEQTSEQTTTA